MKKIYFGYSIFQFILFIISITSFTLLIYLSITKKEFYFIMMSFVPIVWMYFITSETSVCIFREDSLHVKADTSKILNYQQFQRKFTIKYDDIESINIITTTIHDTQGNEIPIVVPNNLYKEYISIKKNVIPGKGNIYVPAYYRIYGSKPLTILKINLKNKKNYEGIILNLYNSKKREKIIEEIKSKINKN